MTAAPPTYFVGLLLYAKASTNCSGVPLGSSVLVSSTTVGSWTTVSDQIMVPAGTQSIDFRVIVGKAYDPDVVGLADKIWLRPKVVTNTPVFTDGFEGE